ncbi:hypothetical protein CSB94_3906 [Pseudomonas aeruginosa]|nr:hypothetical protein CSB94_3906 [Pseudomonas aeruginosa]
MHLHEALHFLDITLRVCGGALDNLQDGGRLSCLNDWRRLLAFGDPVHVDLIRKLNMNLRI